MVLRFEGETLLGMNQPKALLAIYWPRRAGSELHPARYLESVGSG